MRQRVNLIKRTSPYSLEGRALLVVLAIVNLRRRFSPRSCFTKISYIHNAPAIAGTGTVLIIWEPLRTSIMK